MPLHVEQFKPHGAVQTSIEPSCRRQLLRCSLCHKLPAKGTKLKHCGSCLSIAYCCTACQVADWPKHKEVCKISTAADYGADKRPGHGRYDTQVSSYDDWYRSIPGLQAKVMRLAWVYRKKSPMIIVSTYDDPAVPVIEVHSRRQWEAIAKGLQGGVPFGVFLDRASFDPNKTYFYMCALHHGSFRHATTSGNLEEPPFEPAVSKLALYYALTAEEGRAIMAELEDYAATVKNVPDELLLDSRRLLSGIVGDMALKRIGHRVRLAGLRNATHLNGKKVLVVGRDPNSILDRVIVRFDDGEEVSVGQGHW